jgi:DNA-binding CsgD family transcriptional regulator
MPEPGTGERNNRRRPAGPLSGREREILGLLAAGESGAQIAERLVLSPETVRTHIRNAMLKLGASSRAQAVALAVYREEIEGPLAAERANRAPPGDVRRSARARIRARSAVAVADSHNALAGVLSGLLSLYDVEAGALFLTDEDGLSLRRAAMVDKWTQPGVANVPESIPLGEGALGRAALERRARLVNGTGGPIASLAQATIIAPMVASGRLTGVICLATRSARLIGRNDLLLLQAFANRIAEILIAPGEPEDKLKEALRRFRASWARSDA